ncbi:MAG: class I SAM-dependent methyltransferase [Chlamydiia bacterium]|nr:class I SAM-dependent methyltransferase [Chlamydiia bacterium]
MTAQDVTVPYHTLRPLSRVLAGLQPRTQIAFLAPYLHSGMRILDCGCGDGAVTCELARWVEPGTVVGIDVESASIERAQAYARAHDVGNVSFETGSVLEIPFDSHSFDLVFCNGVLCQMAHPELALIEMQRVTHPRGIVAAREPDYTGALWYPDSIGMQQAYTLQLRAIEALGGNLRVGRALRYYFAEAGMSYSEGSASCDSYGTPESIEALASYLRKAWQEAQWSQHIRNECWIDELTIASFLEAISEFSEDPNAFLAIPWCEAISSV